MRELPTDADVIIVGAGMAGLALARELEVGNGPRPIIVEAGPDAGLDHYRYALEQPEALDFWLSPSNDPAFWRPYRSLDGSFEGLAGLRRRTGGRSLYWHGVSLQIEDWALRSGDWPTEVANDLLSSWNSGPSLYTRTSDELSEWSGRDSLGGPPVAMIGDLHLSEAPIAIRTESDGRSRIYSPAEHWRGAQRTLPIVNDALTLGIVERNRTVAAVRFLKDGTEHEIRTRAVVLCAGTIENSRLAIQLLAGADRLPTRTLFGLADKIAQGFVAILDPGRMPRWLVDAAQSSLVFVAPTQSDLRSNLFVRPFLTGRAIGLDTWLMGEHLPGNHGFVSCHGRDNRWPWMPSVSCSLSPVDVELVASQQAELEAVRGALSELTGVALRPLRFDAAFGTSDLRRALTGGGLSEPSPLTATYSFPLGSEHHDSGTLAIGRVLDSDQTLPPFKGVYAAGPCIFPRPGAANPALTILALAKRLARRITIDLA